MTRKLELVRFLTIFVVLVSLFLSSWSDALAIEYSGIGGKPAFPRKDNPRTDSIFVHTLKPGQVQDEGVRIINNTDSIKTLLVYVTDSTPSTGGAFACKQQGEPRTDVGEWITLEKDRVTLGPRSNTVVPFTITIPGNASVGEHNGCVLIQSVSDDVSARIGGASIQVRTGLRVAITVPGKIKRKLVNAGVRYDKSTGEKGKLVSVLNVTNEGNVSIDTDVSVSLKSVFSFRKNPLDSVSGQYPVLRGEVTTWRLNLTKPSWGGWYYFDSVMSYNQDSNAVLGVEADSSRVKGIESKKSGVLSFSQSPQNFD